MSEATLSSGATATAAVVSTSRETDADICRAADLNLAEFIRHTARYGGTILEEEGLLLVAGTHPNPGPYRNCAIRLDDRLPAADVLQRAGAFFGARKRGYVLWVRKHADADLDRLCRTRGMRLLEEDGLPELYSPRRPELAEPPPDVRLARVETEEERLDFLRINAEGWGMEGMSIELAARTFFHPDSIAAPNVAAIMAYVDGRPASGAMAIVTNGSVGGYWGATSPWARRRGLADLCVRKMFNAGFDLGAVRAVCQASGSGEGIWLRMGFARLTKYYRYQSQRNEETWG
jgi:hypothetical protein